MPGGVPAAAAGGGLAGESAQAASAGRGGAGGLLGGSTPGPALTRVLAAGASTYRWVAATTGSNSASGYQLATGDPVMSIGGFNGTDPAPTLAEFQRFVAPTAISTTTSPAPASGVRLRRRLLDGQ